MSVSLSSLEEGCGLGVPKEHCHSCRAASSASSQSGEVAWREKRGEGEALETTLPALLFF